MQTQIAAGRIIPLRLGSLLVSSVEFGPGPTCCLGAHSSGNALVGHGGQLSHGTLGSSRSGRLGHTIVPGQRMALQMMGGTF